MKIGTGPKSDRTCYCVVLDFQYLSRNKNVMGNNRPLDKKAPKNGELSELNDNNVPDRKRKKGNSVKSKGVLGKINDDAPDVKNRAENGN